MAGHSKWANIKHRKGRQDEKRQKVFSKLIRELTVAAKLGGAEPGDNPRLRLALDKALGANMPKDTIERAIARGSGDQEAENLEETIYEGYGPNGVAIILEVITDNKNRSVAELRHIFTKFGGSLGETGSVSWMFEKKGQIILESKSIVYETLFDIVLIAGAENLEKFENSYIITTPFESLMEVKKTIEDHGYLTKSADYQMISKTTQKVAKSESDSVMKLLDTLDNNDDVNRIFSNLDLD